MRRILLFAALFFPCGAEAQTLFLHTGQIAIATTGTAVNLASDTIVNGVPNQTTTNGVLIKAAVTNAASICIGASNVTNTIGGTGNGFCLEAGASIYVWLSNTNVAWINGTAGDYVMKMSN